MILGSSSAAKDALPVVIEVNGRVERAFHSVPTIVTFVPRALRVSSVGLEG